MDSKEAEETQNLDRKGKTDGRSPHLQVSVNDGSLALMKAGHSFTGVAEDVEDLRLTEAHV